MSTDTEPQHRFHDVKLNLILLLMYQTVGWSKIRANNQVQGSKSSRPTLAEGI